MKTTLATLLLLSAICLQAQTRGPEQDAQNAIWVCQPVYVQNNTYDGEGVIEDIELCSTTCLSNWENNSVWYRFYVARSGMVVFTIAPMQTDDYDFAVYNITGLDSFTNGALCPNEVRCSYAAPRGGTVNNAVTGLQYGVLQTVAGVPDSAFLAPLAVSKGEEYLILVDNFATGGGGYTIDFTGSTAMIGSREATITSVVPVVCSGDTSLIANLATEVDVNSIAPDGSDFAILGTPAVTILSVEALNGGAGVTQRIKLQVSSAIINGGYSLVLQAGTDSNTLQTTNAVCSSFFPPDTVVVDDTLMSVNTLPVAAFSYVKTGQDFQYINLSTDADMYIWNFDDSTRYSSVMNPYHRFERTGLMNVCLTASNLCYADMECLPLHYRDNRVTGTIIDDKDADCFLDTSDRAMIRTVVVAQPGAYYGISDSDGNYTIDIDTGIYTITQLLPVNNYFSTTPLCPLPNEYMINTSGLYGRTFSGKNFFNDREDCHYITTNIVSSGFRFCGPNTTYVQLCNEGTIFANPLVLVVDMPDIITVTNVNQANYTIDTSGNIVIPFNSLKPGMCYTVIIKGDITCNNPQALMNSTHCVHAGIMLQFNG